MVSKKSGAGAPVRTKSCMMAICPSATASPVLSSGQWGAASRAAVEGAGQKWAGHNLDIAQREVPR